MIRDFELRKKALDLRREKRNYTKIEFNIMAKVAGIKYFARLKKHELAEKLGIELKPKSKRAYTRAVEIFNSDGTTTTYPSMTQASKAFGSFPVEIYTMVDRDEARFL